MLLLWILTNASALTRQSNWVSLLCLNPHGILHWLICPDKLHAGEKSNRCTQNMPSMDRTELKNGNCSHSKIQKIWFCHASPFVQQPLERTSCATLLGAQTQSPWDRAHIQGLSQAKGALQGVWGIRVYMTSLPPAHIPKAYWVAGMTTTSRSTGGQGRATPPWLWSRARQSVAKQELPHHDTIFGGTE